MIIAYLGKKEVNPKCTGKREVSPGDLESVYKKV